MNPLLSDTIHDIITYLEPGAIIALNRVCKYLYCVTKSLYKLGNLKIQESIHHAPLQFIGITINGHPYGCWSSKDTASAVFYSKREFDIRYGSGGRAINKYVLGWDLSMGNCNLIQERDEIIKYKLDTEGVVIEIMSYRSDGTTTYAYNNTSDRIFEFYRDDDHAIEYQYVRCGHDLIVSVYRERYNTYLLYLRGNLIREISNNGFQVYPLPGYQLSRIITVLADSVNQIKHFYNEYMSALVLL